MTVYVCGVTSLFRRWLDDDSITQERVNAAATAAQEYFISAGFDSEIQRDKKFWERCPIFQPYLYLATTDYSRDIDEHLQNGADILLEHL